MKKTFPTRWRSEGDLWSDDGSIITSDKALEAIHAEFKRGPILVEHRYYRGGSAPSLHVFEEWEDFEAYMDSEPSAGDNIYVWSCWQMCQEDQCVTHGKCPADDGKVPAGGAY